MLRFNVGITDQGRDGPLFTALDAHEQFLITAQIPDSNPRMDVV
jgi:hypothetical protein